jgi:hypothetical protein
MALVIIAFIFITLEYILRFSKTKIGEDYDAKREQADRFGDIEKETIVYYRRNQTLDVIRVISAIVGLGMLLIVFDIKALNILAIATGALIIILKDHILSFLGYFYVISVYDIGDDLRIGGVLGEVVRFKPFYMALAGKDDSGEYNGKLLYIPNYKFMSEFVEEQEIKTDTYRRINLQAIYTHTTFEDSFPDWISKVRSFLDETLPLQKTNTVGNYKGFIGSRYKMRFDYNEKGEVLVAISYVAKPPKTSEYKEKIIEFIESQRKTENKTKKIQVK